MVRSKAVSVGESPARRHASEHQRTWSQSRAHFFRQVMVRPQAAQVLVGGGTRRSSPRAADPARRRCYTPLEKV